MNPVSLLRFLPSRLSFLRGRAWVAEGGGVGCRWVGRSWALASLQDRQERARSAGLQALRAARRQLQGRSPAPASRRRRCVPAKPSAAPRLPHAPTHRRGYPGGGRGRARPREGKGPVLPEQAAAAAQEAEAAAAAEAATCPPQSPAASDPRPPVRQPAPRRGALSTARGEYLPRRPPRGRPRDSPGRGRRGPPRPAPLGSTCPAWASAAVGVPGGRTGPSGLPGRRRYKGQPGQWTDPLPRKSVPVPGLGFPVRLGSNDPEVCTPARDKCMSRKWCGRVWTDCVWVVLRPGWFSKGALPQSDRGGTGSRNPTHAPGRS